PARRSIRDGLTRNSILALAPDHGREPAERPVSIDEMWEGLDSGHITETFACGTAAVITPIVGFNSPERGEEAVGDGTPGVKTREIREHLLEIQYGRAEDKHGWMRRVV